MGEDTEDDTDEGPHHFGGEPQKEEGYLVSKE